MSKIYKKIKSSNIKYQNNLFDISTPENDVIFQNEKNLVDSLSSVQAYYAFTDQANLGKDTSGQTRDAINNSTIFTTTTEREFAINFPNNAYLDLTSYISNFSTFSNLGISFWIQVNGSTSESINIFTASVSGTSNFFSLYIDFDSINEVGIIRILVSAVNVADPIRVENYFSLNTQLLNDTWYHIFIQTGTGGLPSIYVNGTSRNTFIQTKKFQQDLPLSSVSASIDFLPNNSRPYNLMTIGNSLAVDPQNFILSSIIIFNSIVSETNIKNLANSGFKSILVSQSIDINELNSTNADINNINPPQDLSSRDPDKLELLNVDNIDTNTDSVINISSKTVIIDNTSFSVPAGAANGLGSSGQRIVIFPATNDAPYGIGLDTLKMWVSIPDNGAKLTYRGGGGSGFLLQMYQNGVIQSVFPQSGGEVTLSTPGGNLGIILINSTGQRYNVFIDSDANFRVSDSSGSGDILTYNRLALIMDFSCSITITPHGTDFGGLPSSGSDRPAVAIQSEGYSTNTLNIAVSDNNQIALAILPAAASSTDFYWGMASIRRGNSLGFFDLNRDNETLFQGIARINESPYIDNITFTGQHRCCSNIISGPKVGYIIRSTGIMCSLGGTTRQSQVLYGKDAININNSLPVVEYSDIDRDPGVYGVISDKEDSEVDFREFNFGVYSSVYNKAEGDNRLIINSLGEGALWITNIAGNLNNGDYITSSTLPGLGARQTDDLLHNYTVAKITMDCDFSGGTAPDADYEIKYVDATGRDITEAEYLSQGGYIAAFVGCTYHCA
jgi:hypothetical protein